MPPVSRPPVKRTRPALTSMSALGEVLMKLYSRDLDRVKFVTGDLEIRVWLQPVGEPSDEDDASLPDVFCEPGDFSPHHFLWHHHIWLRERHVAADDAITLSQVLNAWRNREQQVKSFRFLWTEERFQTKGTLELPPDQKQNVAAFPPRDTTYRLKCSCEMDRDMMRYGFSGESLQVYNDGALEHREYVSASDGVVSRAFWPIPNKLRLPQGDHV